LDAYTQTTVDKRPRQTSETLAIERSRSSATFSADGMYRYNLSRSWLNEPCKATSDAPAGVLLFVGLNPSTADGIHDDPTIRRLIGFAKAWGHDGLEVCNLFAFRSTSPKGLKQASDPIGSENDQALTDAARGAGRILCGWGNGLMPSDVMRNRVGQVVALLEAAGPNVCCLHVTKLGQPQHPLYVRAETCPTPYHGPM